MSVPTQRSWHRLFATVIGELEAATGSSFSPMAGADLLGIRVTQFTDWMEGESFPNPGEFMRLRTGLRRAFDLAFIRQYEDVPGSVVKVLAELSDLHQSVHMHLRRQQRAVQREASLARQTELEQQGPPPVVADLPHLVFKPDPALARTPEEFVQAMIEFREWAGGTEQLTARKLETWSKSAFSHTTINNILRTDLPFDRKPKVRLAWVVGFVTACGGGTEDVQRWSAAWRSAYKGLTPARHPAKTTTQHLPVGPPAEVIQTAYSEGLMHGETLAKDSAMSWLTVVAGSKPKMPSDIETTLLRGSVLPPDLLLFDDTRQALREGFWQGLEAGLARRVPRKAARNGGDPRRHDLAM